MKKLLAIGVLTLLFACAEEKPEYAILNGTVENNTGETTFVRGYDFEKRMPISENGTFSDTLHISKDGFYELYIGRERTGVYLEKGGTLTVTVDANEFDETLNYSGTLSSENNYLAAKFLWNEKNLNFRELYSLDENAFKKQLERNKQQMDSIYKAKKVDNETFKKSLEEENVYANAALVENYEEAYRYYSGSTDFKVSSEFYDDLKKINYTDTLAFRNSVAYQNLLETHYNRLISEEPKNNATNQTLALLKKVDAELPDGYAKDKIMNSYLQYGLSPNESLEETYTIYKNSNPNPGNLAKITERYTKLKQLTKGNPSPTFNFENHKGGTTSLESLSGKYVYIDVWATWCSPCLREIPYLKEVENEYKSKNIEFVSLSIDEEKDYDKWRGMVTENDLGGIQLMADNNWNSKFVQEYAILGIPRFILIDPQGIIVSADAPRPSDPQLKNMLDGLM
ncbi:TlpA family protein disulfide reductase [Aequorivita echinoideorum]|uniref:TlpA family protein disulfide reductase n=1 Tax=Aequorivita echinoideorum TaxID=1549647 RepID=A0ABS5S688_9FLAO|nr:TlpA disulfide reductase family protein [Aequorivita echinoideorum]MBT0608731.1 TlpA family protein disulfide reductase [Aequorivita echinoideorum]